LENSWVVAQNKMMTRQCTSTTKTTTAKSFLPTAKKKKRTTQVEIHLEHWRTTLISIIVQQLSKIILWIFEQLQTQVRV